MTEDSAGRRNYVQFPIYLLRTGSPICDVGEKEKAACMDAMLAMSARTYGAKLLDGFLDKVRSENDCEMSEDELRDLAERRIYPVDKKGEYEPMSDAGINVAFALDRWGLDPTDTTRLLSHLPTEKHSDGSRIVRIRLDIFLDARRHWSWRKFAVLCGLYAGIGNRRYKQVTNEQIIAMALGFNSPKALTTEALTLSRSKLRTTMDQLKQVKLFVKQTVKRRITRYSKSLTLYELQQAILEERVLALANYKNATDEFNADFDSIEHQIADAKRTRQPATLPFPKKDSA